MSCETFNPIMFTASVCISNDGLFLIEQHEDHKVGDGMFQCHMLRIRGKSLLAEGSMPMVRGSERLVTRRF